MTMNMQLDNVDVLIPRRFHDARSAAMAAVRHDLAALIEALPAASTTLAMPLVDADVEQSRAWLAAVVRALPTRVRTETEHGAT